MLNEPKPPKPARQGDAGNSSEKPAIRKGNSHGAAGKGRTMKGTTTPGKGTRGTAITRGGLSRT